MIIPSRGAGGGFCGKLRAIVSRSSALGLREIPAFSRGVVAVLLAATGVMALTREAAASGLPLSSSFSGAVDEGGGVPPDLQGAAGPDHLLVMLNTVFLAQSKTDGSVLRRWTPADFWTSVAGGDLLFDPRVGYDALAGRWIAVIATEGVTAPPAVLLALSDGSDPTAGWSYRKLAVGGSDYAEFPLLGWNGRWIVVTSNLVSTSTGYLSGSAIWAIDAESLLAGNPAITRWSLDAPGSPIAPAVTLDAGQDDELLLQQASGNDNGHGRVRLFRVTDGGAGPSLSAAKTITAPLTWSDLPNPLESLPQPGSTRKIVSDQDEFASACFRNGLLWAVQTVTVPATASAPLHTEIQWWRIRPDGGLDGFGRIGDSSGSTWLGFPSIAVNGSDQAVIGYSVFSKNMFASAGYSASGCGGDAALAGIHLLKSGEAPYERLDGAGHNRWGDLSQTVADPDGDGIWTLQEYAASPVDGQSRWGTWWGGFAPAAPESRAGVCVAPRLRLAPVPIAGSDVRRR